MRPKKPALPNSLLLTGAVWPVVSLDDEETTPSNELAKAEDGQLNQQGWLDEKETTEEE